MPPLHCHHQGCSGQAKQENPVTRPRRANGKLPCRVSGGSQGPWGRRGGLGGASCLHRPHAAAARLVLPPPRRASAAPVCHQSRACSAIGISTPAVGEAFQMSAFHAAQLFPPHSHAIKGYKVNPLHLAGVSPMPVAPKAFPSWNGCKAPGRNTQSRCPCLLLQRASPAL